MTEKPEQIAGYLDLTNNTLSTFLDAHSAWATRLLRYAKASFDIVAKPYGLTTTPAALMNENLERTNSLVELSKEQIQSTGTAVVELGDKLVNQANTWQETAQHGADELQKVLVANLDLVKERTEAQMDRFAKPQAPASRNTSSSHRRTTPTRPKKSRKA
ncbi:MAG: hypothetical protein M3Z14_02745 [Candidatus Eremiobacteraeota bacterium]|nr:hypothetical protein [Candidatus Eremiobacteraeota bacterium]